MQNEIVVVVTGSDQLPPRYKHRIRERIAELTSKGKIGFIVDAGCTIGADQYASELAEDFLAANIRADFTTGAMPAMRRCDRIVMMRAAGALKACGYPTFVEVWAPWGWGPLRRLEEDAKVHGLEFRAHPTGGDGA